MHPVYVALIAIFAVALIALFVWFSNSCFCVTSYKEKANVQKSVRVVHLSDLHAKRFGKGNKRLLKKIAELNPDFIAFTGDIVHLYRKRDIEVAKEFISSASKIAPIVYVAGNHEMRSKKYRALREDIISCGAVVLDNSSVHICGLTVVGLNCAFLRNDKLFSIVPENDDYKILLAHEPQYLEKYSGSNCSLVLCGHAHGGQWRIPFTKIGILAPGQGFFPKYISGRHIMGSTHMIVSRGLGNSEFPLRLFNRPEVVVIDIENN